MTGQPANIAVAVVVVRNGKVLLGKRKASGTWGFPGGSLEGSDQTLEGCGEREVYEETGVKIKKMKLVSLVPEFIQERQVFYFTMIAVAEWDENEPFVKEPTKAEEWAWFEWNQLPAPLFPPNKTLIESGFDPFR